MAYRLPALGVCLVVAVALVLCACVLPVLAHGSAGPAATPEPDRVGEPRSAPALRPGSAIIARIPAGGYPFGIAANPITHRIYVANRDGYSVTVIDSASNTVIGTIPVGAQPWAQVAVDAKTNRIYVVNNGSNSLSVIDGASDSVIATVSGLGSAPEGVGVHSGRNRVYVSHSANQLSVIDATTNTRVGVLDTGNYNHSVVVNESADRAYVLLTAPNATAVMDLATGGKIGELDAGGFMAFNADTNRLYITELESPGLTVVDTTNNSKIARIGIDSGGGSPAINWKTHCIYAPNRGSGTMTVINAETNVVVGTISGLDRSAFAAAADPEAGLVYVTEPESNTVAVILATTCSADPAMTPTMTPTPTATFTPTATPTPTHTPTPVPGAITGIAWYDANGNGVREEDEPGLYGVKVALYRSGLMIGEQYTRGDGRYRFAALPPAGYVVRETQPRWLRYSTTRDEVRVTVAAGGEASADFGDWNGRRLYLPLLTRRR